MDEFIAKYQNSVEGVISGFDRLVFRGTLRRIAYTDGMMEYLWQNQVLLKDFGRHAQQVSEGLKSASLEPFRRQGRPVIFLRSSQVSKEAIAQQVVEEQGIRKGLVCAIRCVEPANSYEIFRCRDSRRLELVQRRRQCLFLYHYWIHPEFGFVNARIQTWFPFGIQICLNGREWLARQMDRQGLPYRRQDNGFPWIQDYERAQRLLDQQLRVQWPSLLNQVAAQLNPRHAEMFARYTADYYWSCPQSEWATDLVFAPPAEFRRLFPLLVRHAITSFSSPDVLRFLGRKVGEGQPVRRPFSGEVGSDVKHRQEGVRIKHRLNQNAIKFYDKADVGDRMVGRVEMTLNQEGDFRVYRPKEGDPQGPLAWRPLRCGLADLHRRAEVSQKANERYLDALASVDDSATVAELAARIQKRVVWNGQPFRALHPFDPEDSALLQAINRGEFTINGLRNRDLQRLLFAPLPARRGKLANDPRPSAANSVSCEPTDSSAKSRTPTGTT
jgi:hypothetical protein